MRCRTLHRRTCAAACVFVFVEASMLGSAATIDWVGHNVGLKHTFDGTFSDSINWNTGAVPGSSDTADFNANATYTVNFTNSPINMALLVPVGSVTFATSIAPSYLVGSAGVNGQLTLNKVNLLSTGDVTIIGSGALLGPVNASLTVNAATQLTSGSVFLGAGSSLLRSTSGTLTVTGASALVTQLGSSNLTIGTAAPILGSGSSGLLHVDSGGAFTTGNGSIQVNQLGTINLTGGTFNAQGNMTITGGVLESDAAGQFNLASGHTLTVQNGGRVDLNNSSGQQLGGVTVVVDGSGSHFNTGSSLYVGSGGLTTNMTWQNGATGTLGGLVVGNSDIGTKGTVTISGASVTSASTSLGSDLPQEAGTINIINGGTLTAGQLSVGGVSSPGTISLSGGNLITPDDAVIRTRGTVALVVGLFQARGNLSVIDGSLQADASSSFQLGNNKMLFVSGKVDLNGEVTAPGATILVTGAGNHLNMAQAPNLDSVIDVTSTLTYQNGATGTLTSGLNLGETTVRNSHGIGNVTSGAKLSSGNINIGTGGAVGSSGQLTVNGNGSSVTQNIAGATLVVGAASNSTGLVQVDNGGMFMAGATMIEPTGTLSITGGTFQASQLTATGGAVQSNAAGTVTADTLTIQNGGHVDLAGAFSGSQPSSSPGHITVDGAGSHLNLAQPLVLGKTVQSVLMFQNGAAGNLAGGLDLDESTATNALATIDSGAQVIAGNIGVGANGMPANAESSLVVQGAGTSLTQTGATTLNVGNFGAGNFSTGTMRVQNGGTFSSGTGPTLVSVNSTLDVLGGTYNANGDMTISASTLTLDAASHFALAPGKTITFKNDAMITLKGPFTGGNVDNEVSLDVNSPAMAVQAFDGGGDLTVAAGAHLTADHIRQSSLTLSGNASVRPQLTPNSDSSASSFDRLRIMAAGQFDLANNRLAIIYPAGQSPIAAIRSYLTTGYNNGAWNGPGIITTSGDANHTLGYADSADGVVKNLPANTVLVEFARSGDADLDGQVDFSDLVTVARNYGRSNANWDQGDFNYDGKVGFDDLVAVARNYGKPVTAAQLATFDPSMQAAIKAAFAEVPEPNTIVAMLVAGIAALSRRRA